MDPFIGEIIMFGGNFAPRGWAFCDGQLLPISQNTALFSILGTTYGGDGRTTFALPDLRGRVAIHPGRGPGLSDYRLGQKGGQERVTITIAEMPSHSHIANNQVTGGVVVGTSDDSPDTEEGGGNHLGKTNSDDVIYTQGAISGVLGGVSHNLGVNTTILNQGGNLPHNNLQPYECVNFIIAIQGIFPSRG